MADTRPENVHEAKPWWQTFLSVAITTAQIAAKVLPIILMALEEDDTSGVGDFELALQTGLVVWEAAPGTKDIRVRNVDETRSVLVTVSQEADVPKSDGFVLEHGTWISVREVLEDYTDSQVVVALPDVPSAPATPNGRNQRWHFAYAALRAGTMVYLLNTSRSLLWNRDNDGNFRFEYRADAPPAALRVNAANREGELRIGPEEAPEPGTMTVYTVVLPPSVEMVGDTLTNVVIDLELTSADFAHLFRRSE